MAESVENLTHRVNGQKRKIEDVERRLSKLEAEFRALGAALRKAKREENQGDAGPL
jgi:hypothetical protein